MTIKQMTAEISKYTKPALRTQEGLLVPVDIVDVKIAWGRLLLLITPAKGQGKGTAWISEERMVELTGGTRP